MLTCWDSAWKNRWTLGSYSSLVHQGEPQWYQGRASPHPTPSESNRVQQWENAWWQWLWVQKAIVAVMEGGGPLRTCGKGRGNWGCWNPSNDLAQKRLVDIFSQTWLFRRNKNSKKINEGLHSCKIRRICSPFLIYFCPQAWISQMVAISSLLLDHFPPVSASIVYWHLLQRTGQKEKEIKCRFPSTLTSTSQPFLKRTMWHGEAEFSLSQNNYWRRETFRQSHGCLFYLASYH